MPTDAVLTLFDVCPVPKCSNPVDDGEPCGECAGLIAAGFIVRAEPPEPPPATLDDIRRELAAQQRVEAELARTERAAAQNRGDEWKPGQHCWVCEQRRTCRLDPDQRGQWICKECEEHG